MSPHGGFFTRTFFKKSTYRGRPFLQWTVDQLANLFTLPATWSLPICRSCCTSSIFYTISSLTSAIHGVSVMWKASSASSVNKCSQNWQQASLSTSDCCAAGPSSVGWLLRFLWLWGAAWILQWYRGIPSSLGAGAVGDLLLKCPSFLPLLLLILSFITILYIDTFFTKITFNLFSEWTVKENQQSVRNKDFIRLSKNVLDVMLTLHAQVPNKVRYF